MSCASATKWYQSKVTSANLVLSEIDDKVCMPGTVSVNTTNYTTGKTHIEDILYVKDLYEPILRETIPSSVVLLKNGKS